MGRVVEGTVPGHPWWASKTHPEHGSQTGAHLTAFRIAQEAHTGHVCEDIAGEALTKEERPILRVGSIIPWTGDLCIEMRK